MSIAVSAVAAALWLIVVLGAPWLEGPVREVVNDLDVRFGWWTKARPSSVRPAADDQGGPAPAEAP